MIGNYDKQILKLYIEKLIDGKTLSKNEIQKIYKILDNI